MKRISLKTLWNKLIISGLSALRYNTNGYPFITISDKNGKTTNVYFGKRSAEIVNGTFVAGQRLTALLATADLVETVNEKKETRYKISLPSSNEEWASTAEMEDAFGVREEIVDFNIISFQKEFTAQTEETPEDKTNKNSGVSHEDELALLEAKLDKARSVSGKTKIQAEIDALLEKYPELV